jgi:hypothetical protein
MKLNHSLEIPQHIRIDANLLTNLKTIKSNLAADGLELNMASIIRMALLDWTNRVKSGITKIGVISK